MCIITHQHLPPELHNVCLLRLMLLFPCYILHCHPLTMHNQWKLSVDYSPQILWNGIQGGGSVGHVSCGGWCQGYLPVSFLFFFHLGLQLCVDQHQIFVYKNLYVPLHKLQQVLDFCLCHLETLPLSHQSIHLFLSQSHSFAQQFCFSLFQNGFQLTK